MGSGQSGLAIESLLFMSSKTPNSIVKSGSQSLIIDSPPLSPIRLVAERSLKLDSDKLIYGERHCPEKDEVLKCPVPTPYDYRLSFRWPKTRELAWYANVSYRELTVEKAVQNWSGSRTSVQVSRWRRDFSMWRDFSMRHNSYGTSSLLSLVQTFDSFLAMYEGEETKFKPCRGLRPPEAGRALPLSSPPTASSSSTPIEGDREKFQNCGKKSSEGGPRKIEGDRLNKHFQEFDGRRYNSSFDF